MVDAGVLEEYLSEHPSKDKAYHAKLGKRIMESVEIFDGMGISEPIEQDYERLRAVLAGKPGQKKGTTLSPNVVKDWLNNTRGYYAKKAGRKPMTEQVEVIESVSDSEQQQPLKRGRKPKPENERRNVKISIYLTQGVYEAVKALAAGTERDMSDVIFEALEDLAERNSEQVKAYHDFLARFRGIE